MTKYYQASQGEKGQKPTKEAHQSVFISQQKFYRPEERIFELL